MEEKVQGKVANARLQSGQLARDCKLLQVYSETGVQSTHYSPGTAKRKKKKLAKGSQTKQSTCSMIFWALAWELDHVAYRTIIRKGVSRLIIKELRAYQPWVADVLRAIKGVKKSSGELWRNPAKTHAQTHLITKYVYMTSMSDSSVF